MLGEDIKLKDDDIDFTGNQDFTVVSDRENLAQAIKNRILTRLGEYYNTAYGSELFKTLGSPRNDVTLNRVKGFVYETLIQDPRILEVESVTVSYGSSSDSITLELTVSPDDSISASLDLTFPVTVVD